MPVTPGCTVTLQSTANICYNNSNGYDSIQNLFYISNVETCENTPEYFKKKRKTEKEKIYNYNANDIIGAVIKKSRDQFRGDQTTKYYLANIQ